MMLRAAGPLAARPVSTLPAQPSPCCACDMDLACSMCRATAGRVTAVHVLQHLLDVHHILPAVAHAWHKGVQACGWG